MTLRFAHVSDEEQLKLFDKIYTTDIFSIAEYKSHKGEKLQPFIHSHEAYEFVAPFTTMPLLYYMKAGYLGEVGYCYPVNPFAPHGVEVELESDVVSLVVDKKYLDRIKKELGFGNQMFYNRFLLSRDLVSLMEEFISSLDESLIYDIVKILITDGLKDNTDNRKPERTYFLHMKESILYMSEHFTDPKLSIERIAAESEYSYTYFTKAFKRYMHDTPINHLTKLRLSRAKRLMKNPSLSLAEISDLAGFKTPSSFTEAFKRLVGYTPREFRDKFL